MNTVSPQVIEALRGYDSPTIANAIEHFKVRDPTSGYATNELLCQTPEIAAPMVGYALTARADGTTPGDTRPSRVDDFVELIEAAPKPVALVVQHVGPDRKRSCLIGDMFCTIAQKFGAVGMVTDSNGRDPAGIRMRTPEFHLFTTGWVVSHGYPVYVDFHSTVSICGLTVSPGDLLHGDASGLVSIPTDIAGDLVKRAQAVREEEADYFAFLDSDRFSLEEVKRRIVPHK
ncbi:MAG: hypothetical protein CL878_07590 [Dehalococcoidia bacterium]|nr:hypothetical protein [Dehalococcoidia bacterium]